MCECLEFECKATPTLYYIWLPGRSIQVDDNEIRGYCLEHLDSWATREGMTTEEFAKYMDTGSTRVFDTLEAAQLYQIKTRL